MKDMKSKQPKPRLPFIINPAAGRVKKVNIEEAVQDSMLPDIYDISFIYTKGPGDATDIAKDWSKRNARKIAVFGGDGTVNEVARALIHSKSSMGIIPGGSGNGLSNHLKIPLNIKQAISVIAQSRIMSIDHGVLNDIPFFCTCGVGFDALIGHRFAEAGTRGFKTYVKSTIHEYFKYKPQKYSLKVKGKKKLRRKAFLVSFANASQYGNNAFIAPNANIQDGLIDVCILKPFPNYRIFDIGIRLFTKKLDTSKYLETFKAKKVTLKFKKPCEAHYDGEPCFIDKKVKIEVVPNALNVLVPF